MASETRRRAGELSFVRSAVALAVLLAWLAIIWPDMAAMAWALFVVPLKVELRASLVHGGPLDPLIEAGKPRQSWRQWAALWRPDLRWIIPAGRRTVAGIWP
jgi:hypothetical protein